MPPPLAAPLTPDDWLALRGVPEAPPRPTPLALSSPPGSSLALDYSPGETRRLRLISRDGTDDLALRVYAAVRDENWATLPARLSEESLRVLPDGVHAAFTCTHSAGGREVFAWTGRISLTTTPTGFRCRWELRGRALTDFRRNRIGFCILHPANLAGLPVDLHTAAGSTRERFPLLIDPRQPPPGFTGLIGLSHGLRNTDTRLNWTFTGDLFETEDQRNWTDLSFKTFCTPLGLPRPVLIREGETVEQSVELEIVVPAASASPEIVITDEPVITLSREHLLPSVPRPAIGVCLTPGSLPTAEEIESLRGIDHLRVELRTDDPAELARAVELALRLHCGLELALYLPPDTTQPLPGYLRPALAHFPRPLAAKSRWCLYPHRETYAGGAWPECSREALRAILPAPVAACSEGDFIFFNRLQGPPPVCADAVAFQINPQTHADDELSLIETLDAQPDTVRTARVISLGRCVVVTPITLRHTKNLYTASGDPLPLPTDPRIKSHFAAGWTLGSIARLAAAGVTHLTYHHTHGPGGIALTPTAALLRHLSTATTFAPIRSPAPQQLSALQTPTMLLVANHTAGPLRVELKDLGQGHPGGPIELPPYRLTHL